MSNILDKIKAELESLAKAHDTLPVPSEDTILLAILTAAIRSGSTGSGGICPLETDGSTKELLCIAVVAPNGPGQTYHIHGLALERTKLALAKETEKGVETPQELSPQTLDTLKDLPSRSI